MTITETQLSHGLDGEIPRKQNPVLKSETMKWLFFEESLDCFIEFISGCWTLEPRFSHLVFIEKEGETFLFALDETSFQTDVKQTSESCFLCVLTSQSAKQPDLTASSVAPLLEAGPKRDPEGLSALVEATD